MVRRVLIIITSLLSLNLSPVWAADPEAEESPAQPVEDATVTYVNKKFCFQLQLPSDMPLKELRGGRAFSIGKHTVMTITAYDLSPQETGALEKFVARDAPKHCLTTSPKGVTRCLSDRDIIKEKLLVNSLRGFHLVQLNVTKEHFGKNAKTKETLPGETFYFEIPKGRQRPAVVLQFDGAKEAVQVRVVKTLKLCGP